VATNFAQHLSSGIVSIYLGNGAWVFETSINLSNLSTALESLIFMQTLTKSPQIN
jgi:hypothetical protein